MGPTCQWLNRASENLKNQSTNLDAKARLLKLSTNLEVDPTFLTICRLNFSCEPWSKHRTDRWGFCVYGSHGPSLPKPKTPTDTSESRVSSEHEPSRWRVGPTSTSDLISSGVSKKRERSRQSSNSIERKRKRERPWRRLNPRSEGEETDGRGCCWPRHLRFISLLLDSTDYMREARRAQTRAQRVKRKKERKEGWFSWALLRSCELY